MSVTQRQLGIQRLSTDRPAYTTPPAQLMTPIQRIESMRAMLELRRDAAHKEWVDTGMDSSKDFIRNNRRARYERAAGAVAALDDALLMLKGEA